MLNARRRHDALLRRYLTLLREREDAQAGGSSASRVERIAVRERALAGALRGVRLYLGLPEAFDIELESARLGLAGKRFGRLASRTRTVSDERSDKALRPEIKPVPSSPGISRRNGDNAAPRCRAELAVTVSDLLVFVTSHHIDPESEIVVRRLSGGHSNADRDLVNVAFIGLTEDSRVQLDIH